MKHMMIDLETMSTSRDAAIVSLGIALFDQHGVTHKTGCVVNLTSCLMRAGQIDAETVGWWRMQTLEAQEGITRGGVHVDEAMNLIRDAWEKYQCERVWSHGSNFDIEICQFYGKMPWTYKQIRDTRTLYETAENLDWKRQPMSGVAHRAVDDAVAQAEAVISAWKWIGDT